MIKPEFFAGEKVIVKMYSDYHSDGRANPINVGTILRYSTLHESYYLTDFGEGYKGDHIFPAKDLGTKYFFERVNTKELQEIESSAQREYEQVIKLAKTSNEPRRALVLSTLRNLAHFLRKG
jgi:hypothetical protein